jgi:hypothetical protein
MSEDLEAHRLAAETVRYDADFGQSWRLKESAERLANILQTASSPLVRHRCVVRNLERINRPRRGFLEPGI